MGKCCSLPGLGVANYPAPASRQLKMTSHSQMAASLTCGKVLGQQGHSIHHRRASGQP